MSSENEQQLENSTVPTGGMKRHHSIEPLDAVKEAKIDHSPQKNGTKETTNGTNGHHETHKTDNEVLEKGNIVFMYKPKLDVDEAASLDDVQLFHVLLEPDEPEKHSKGDDGPPKTRVIKIGKKKLPSSDGKDRFWAFVEKADDDMEQIEEKLEAQSYQTATVGTRTIKADRIAGKGKYVMAKHEGNRTIFGYVLESPADIGLVQKAFNIIKEASFTLSVKNPKKPSPPAAGLDRSQKADFPEDIQRKFGSYQWLPAEPAMLDINGCELLWIGSSEDLEQALGEIGRELEEEADAEMTATEVMKDVRLNEKEHPTQPLVDGEWPQADDAPEKQEQKDETKPITTDQVVEENKTDE